MGHRGTGKSSIIRSLAMAVGARLTEVAMTPSVDVTELLGCYEQVGRRPLFFSILKLVCKMISSPNRLNE